MPKIIWTVEMSQEIDRSDISQAVSNILNGNVKSPIDYRSTEAKLAGDGITIEWDKK